MLKNKHYLYDKIYKISTVVGVIDADSIEELEYIGITEDHRGNKYIIIDYSDYDYSDYSVIENDRLLFDTKEEAAKYIGYYNNGKKFMKLVDVDK